MPRSNRPEQTRTKAMRSRWERSMLACTLNTNAENGASSGRGLPSTSARGVGGGREVDDRVEQHAHAEVGERRAEEHRRRLAGEERLQVEVGADRVEQVELVVGRLGPRVALLGRGPRRRRRPPRAPSVAPRAVRVKRVNSPVRRSITPRKSPAMPTGHVTGVGRRPICSSISSSSSSGSQAGTVPLVDEA